MPSFPRHQSEGQITTQQPSFLAAEDTSGQITEKIGEVGKEVQNAALKWSNAVDTIQKTTASANFKSGVLDITSRAQNDPDYNNQDQYFKEIEKLRSDSLKGFSSKTAETEAAIDFGYESKVAQIQIQNLYKKKMVDVGQASTLKLLDMAANRPSENMEQSIADILGPQVQAGVFDHKTAYELQEKYVQKGKYNAFLSDLNSNPSQTEKNLAKNSYDFDVKQLEAARGIYEKEVNKIRAVNENELLKAYVNNEESDPMLVRQMMNEGKIDASFAEGLIKKMEDPKPDKPSQDMKFIEYVNRFADLTEKGDKAEIGEVVSFMTDLMKEHAAGFLDTADVKRNLVKMDETLQEKLVGEAEKILEKRSPKTFFQRISFWSDEYAEGRPEIKARMYRGLIDGVMQGGDPDAVLAKIVSDEINGQLTENLNKPDRVYRHNPKTKQRIYSDDGGATWFDTKTNKEIK